jgi:hypothetical protein
MTLADLGSHVLGGGRLVREIVHAPRTLSRRQMRWTIAAALLVGVGFAILSRARLAHTVHTVHLDNIVFGADTFENFKGIVAGQYGVVDPRKHALAQVVLAVLTAPQRWLGISAEASAVNTMAVLVGMFGASLLVLCVRIGASLPLALASCVLVVSTNAFAFHTAVFETYILTALTSGLAVLLFLELADHVATQPGWCAILAGFAGGIAGLSNTPAAAIALVYSALAWSRLARRSPVSRAGWSVAVPCALALACALLPSIARDFAHRDAPLQWAVQYTNRWANIGNFVNASLASDYLVTGAAFSWVAVGIEPICRYTASDVSRLGHAPWALFGLIGGLALVGYAARRIVRDPAARPLAVGLLVVAGVFVAFYWYFNPWEGMLYSSQWMLMVVGLVVLGLRRARGAALAVLVVAVAMLVSNEPLTWPTRETFAQACPADHLPPWEQGTHATSP